MSRPRIATLKPRIATLKADIASTATASARQVKRKFYDSARWRFHIRPQQLERHPLCEDCLAQGLTVPAQHVDHRNNDQQDNRPEALRSLCPSCHSRKTATADGGFGNQAGGAK